MICTAVLVLCAAVGALAAPPSPAAPAPAPAHDAPSTIIPIISQSEELEPNGTYKFSFETGNGIKREEISYDKTLPPDAQARSAGDSSNDTDSDEIHVQQGSYSYTAPDGTLISLRYTADENGFQPVGDHLPTSPPIAENIQKSLSEHSTGGSSGEGTLSARSGKAISSPAAAPAPAAAAAAPSPPEAPSATEVASTPEAAAPTEAAAVPTEAAAAATTEAAAAPEAQEAPAEPSTQAAASTTPAA